MCALVFDEPTHPVKTEKPFTRRFTDPTNIEILQQKDCRRGLIKKKKNGEPVVNKNPILFEYTTY